MLGYLIVDDPYCPDEVVVRAIGNMSTFTMHSRHEVDGARMYLFGNRQQNSYVHETSRFLLAATGTFIYRASRGDQALEQLGVALAQGRSIEDEYHDFHGPHTLVVLDRHLERLSVVTDREGLQHAFASRRNGAWASSSSQLLLASIGGSELDFDAVREFVHLGRCFEQRTLFKNVERLPAATMLTRADGQWRSRQLWRIRVEQPCLPDSRAQAVDETWAMLDRAVRVAGTVEPGRLLVDLTGGADTRTVLSFLLRHHPALTVTTGGAADHADIVVSKKLAAKLDLPHFWHPTDQCPPLTRDTLDAVVEISDGNLNFGGILQFVGYLQERSSRFTMNMGGHGGPLLKDHVWLFEFNRTGLNREPNWRRLANLSMVNHVIQDDFFVGFDRGIFADLSEIFHKRSQEIRGTNNQKLDYVYFTLKAPPFRGAWLTMLNHFHDVYHPMFEADIVQYAINIKPEIRKYNALLFSMIHRNNRTLAWNFTDTGVPAVPPVGRFAPLKALVLRRYARSAFRKLRTFGFGRPAHTGPRSADPVVDGLWSAGCFDLLDHDRMAIAPIVSRRRLAEMLANPKQGSNQIYLVNALAVELFVERVKALSGRPAWEAGGPAPPREAAVL